MILIALTGFIIITFMCSLAMSIEFLIVMRFLQALCIGVLMVSIRAGFIKRFSTERVEYIFMVYFPYVILTGVIAPTLGGVIVKYWGWRGVFLFLAILGLILAGLIYFYYDTNNDKKQKHLTIKGIFCSYLYVLRHKRFIKYLSINFLYFAIMYSFVAQAPFIYHKYNYSSTEIGLVFLPIALGFFLISQVNKYLKKYLSINYMVIITTIFIIIGLLFFIFPFSTRESILPMTIGMVLCSCGLGFSAPISFSKCLTLFPEHSGYASSLLSSIPFFGSMLLSFIVHACTRNSPTLLAIFLGIIFLACSAIYWLLPDKQL
jgi:DHA1 family bicyclomycin/chloramphenicol resistance-like MFS transporter